MSDAPPLLSLNSPESMQLSDCVVTHDLPQLSAIDQFDEAMRSLAKTSGLLSNTEHQDVVAQMLIVSVVSNTETFFKHLFATLTAKCPFTADNIGSVSIPYNAVRSYRREIAALALLEGVLFSSMGVLKKEFKRFTSYEISDGSDLAAAIASYDVVCNLRHAAAHWRGFLDSKAVLALGIHSVDIAHYRLELTSDLVQRAFAACDYLVRLVNETIYQHTVRKWTSSGLMQLDEGTRDKDEELCASLISIFGHSKFCRENNIDRTTLCDQLSTSVTT